MMPAKPEEYDDDATRGEGQRPDNVAGQKEAEANGPSDPFERLSRIVANKVQAHLRRKLPLLKIFYLALRHDSNAVWSLGRHWNRRVRFGLHNLVYIYLVVSPMVYYPVGASIFTNWRQLIDFFGPFMVLHLLNCEANLLTYKQPQWQSPTAWASLPFDHYAKLYVSDLRTDYEVQRGRNILLGPGGDGDATKAVTVMANSEAARNA
jgi:hypothetical protein